MYLDNTIQDVIEAPHVQLDSAKAGNEGLHVRKHSGVVCGIVNSDSVNLFTDQHPIKLTEDQTYLRANVKLLKHFDQVFSEIFASMAFGKPSRCITQLVHGYPKTTARHIKHNQAKCAG